MYCAVYFVFDWGIFKSWWSYYNYLVIKEKIWCDVNPQLTMINTITTIWRVYTHLLIGRVLCGHVHVNLSHLLILLQNLFTYNSKRPCLHRPICSRNIILGPYICFGMNFEPQIRIELFICSCKSSNTIRTPT